MKPQKILFLAASFALSAMCMAATSETKERVRVVEHESSEFKKQSFDTCEAVMVIENVYDFDNTLSKGSDVFHYDCILPLMLQIDNVIIGYIDVVNSKEIRLFDLVTNPIHNKHLYFYRC